MPRRLRGQDFSLARLGWPHVAVVFLPGYTEEEELACDLNGPQLAAKAGYSAAGTLTLLETFKALRKGESEEPSEKHPSPAERIAQAEPLAKASPQNQKPLRIPSWWIGPVFQQPTKYGMQPTDNR